MGGTVPKRYPTGEDEAAGHRIGRFRGGLTARAHQVMDSPGLPLARRVAVVLRSDKAMLKDTLR